MDRYRCEQRRTCDRYWYQPIGVRTCGGGRYCGVAHSCCNDGFEIFDRCNRGVFIASRHINAFCWPQMTLTPFCGRSNCGCRRDDCDDRCRNRWY